MNSIYHRNHSQHLKSDSIPIFAEGISLALSRWHALQMAIENNWGGRDSHQKLEKLVADLYSWFSQPKVPLCIDDLEHMLDEIMILSFNMDIEDGSIEEVAEELMVMHEECLHGNYDSIEKLRTYNSNTKILSQSREVEVVKVEMKQTTIVDIMDTKSQSIDPDGSYSAESGGLNLRPVLENESGQGLPYAPVDWPTPGDVWGWKVGNRINISGFWQDRYLYLPTRLQKRLEKRSFASRPAVQRYIEKEFPGADIDAFFSSFSWRIPAKGHIVAEGETTTSGIHCTEKMAELKVETADCKAGNWMCRLQLQARNYSLPAMDCDICCGEPAFCRDCCCILCCKIVDWAYGGYSFIRCEAKVNENYICGHVAHIDCALRSYMAGTIEGKFGLNVEYYCRRCDQRSDLISHVTRLLQTCESLNCRDDIEKILNVGLWILRDSHKEISKMLLHRIEFVLTKLKSGICPEDVWKLDDFRSAMAAGEIIHSGSNGALSETTEITSMDVDAPYKLCDIQQTPKLITADRIESSEIEEKIERTLQDLKYSQEYEYRIAEERLRAQKDFIVGLHQQLETERSALAKRTSTSSDSDIDALITSIMSKTTLIKQEVLKLKDMEGVAKGFARVPKVTLRDHFGLRLSD
ncbi:putative CDPK adapter [Thalictrum thalictroides]|uniref:Putative CDPK adapter n=1 Tax=Thalictrum thalictroides TaxID=46969 RepID=A0A7J6UW80_THATH|nr:putative CDPK adapter [Thalictrum thalictroides]